MPLALKVHLVFGTSAVKLLFALGWTAMVAAVVLAAVGRVAPLTSPSYDGVAHAFVISVEETDEGDSDQQTVAAHFVDDQGTGHVVRSYTTHPPQVGAEVDVRYQRARPEHAVIAGHRSHPWSAWEILILTGFGLFGLVVVVPGRTKRLALRLLARGVITQGRITGVKKHEPEGDEGPSWTVTYELTTADRVGLRRELEMETKPRYEVGETWPVLYDPGWPDHATLFAHLDGQPRIADDGTIAYHRSSWKLGVSAAIVAASAVLLVTALALFVGAWF